MSIGAGGILRLSLALGFALGLALNADAVSAQTPAGGTWTDPPARSAAPAGPTPTPASPAGPAKEPAPVASKGDAAAEIARAAQARTTVSVGKRARSAASVARPADATTRRRTRDARHARAPGLVAEVPHVRIATPRRIARRETPRRVVAHAYGPRMAAPVAYPYAPLPVGRVAGPVDGERRPIFMEGDDRMRRIAAAQAAGYLVVRARSVQYPDGRRVRSYRAYEEDDGLD